VIKKNVLPDEGVSPEGGIFPDLLAFLLETGYFSRMETGALEGNMSPPVG